MIKKILMPVCRILIVLIGITFLSFSLMYLGPGDPAEKYLAGGDGNKGTISEEAIQAQREKWGLDKPFLVQYGVWLGRVFHGNLGNSYSTGRPVLQELTKKAGPTASLAFASMLVCIIISVPLGVLCAYHKDGVIDNISRIFSFIGISLPSFLVSLILLYVLSVRYHWFSISGENGIKAILLPMAVLAFQSSAKLTRQVRSVVLAELNRPYVQGARARGVSKNRILFCHVLRNSWMPILTLIGIHFGIQLGGAAVVESVFSWQGLGQLAVSAVRSSDYTLLQGIVLWLAIMYLVINFIIDISYAGLDPRVRKGMDK
ncbi:MAG: ABC transporter permease [Eubacteriales bacterium]|nr:ABC transporter permease [uncultured Blautia sp.]MDO5782409.1 ABC transporter permease [Eubacteriales bacterium]